MGARARGVQAGVTLRGVTLAAVAGAFAVAASIAEPVHAQTVPGWAGTVPDLDEVVAFDRSQSDFRSAIVRYREDRGALLRRWDVAYSERRRARMQEFYEGWLGALDAADFEGLNREGQADWILLRNRIEFELEELRLEEIAYAEMAPLVTFAPTITVLQEAQRDRLPRIDARGSAETLDALTEEIEALTGALRDGRGPRDVSGVVAVRAASFTGQLGRVLDDWYDFYSGYDPDFTWWSEAPYEAASEALDAHAAAIRSTYRTNEGPVVGDPIGAEGLEAHLKHEMIPYTARELIDIAYAEFEWMEEALLEASREMGYGDDWKAAQEAVKQLAVDPGEKPRVVLELHDQSMEFVQARDWLTIPPLADEVWRMEMMSPQRQLTAPFFLGGEVIQISYPTNTMGHDAKLMSMRGNNPHFNRATVHHELIPGHHLQGFMTDRFNDYRGMFNTPFWGEGWALYWEMQLWDAEFPRGPEDEIGMLFWRMHRAARIIFSLSFHLGEMTPQEAVDFLVDRVGHERANAEAEVRRSFEGSYAPLYQAGYMLGGMQFYSLFDELVTSGRMTAVEYHDAVMKGGRMPVEMVRALLTGQELTRDFASTWRFAG
jgi:hypothetical protein